ncbi:MAG TPA: YciI family protein [Polyangiaceae bacterium]
MRFMVMHKMTDEMERGLAPDPAVIAGVGKLIQEGMKEHVFVSGEGLKPSSERVHIAYVKGKRAVTDGPFSEAKELIAGFGLLRVRSKEEAIACCDKFAAVLGDHELFLGPVVEPWDLGMMPKPNDAPLRFLALQKLNESSPQAPLDAKQKVQLATLIEELTNAGILQSAGGLAGTKQGARVHFKGGKRTVIDGPFAESKELIAGYAILNLPSKAQAIEWAARFGEVVKVNEVEIREMPEE